MSDIEQVYLVCNNGSHRIRLRTFGSVTKYYETLKIRISGAKCNEFETHIDESDYNVLLLNADPKKHPIFKKRYCFLYENQYFEMDIYSFWNDKATIEIELIDEGQAVKLPPEIELICDVSNDFRYKNNYLASIKYEDY